MILSLWRSNSVRRIRPSPVDEARAGLAIVEDVLWRAVPKYLREVDFALKQIDAPPLPNTCSIVQFSSWIGMQAHTYVCTRARECECAYHLHIVDE